MGFLFYTLSGAASTLLDVTTFGILSHYLSSSVAYVVSYAFCVTARYFIDAHFTFHLKHRVGIFLRYFLTNTLVMLLGVGAFRLMLFYVPPLLAKILSIPVTLVAGFILLHFVEFRRSLTKAED